MTTTKMDPNVKEQWLLALRSGEYQQVEGALARPVAEDQPVSEMGYCCCLGVLCEIAVKNGVIAPAEIAVDPEWGDESWVYGAEKATGELPVEVRDWAGLEDANPSVPRHPLPPRWLSDINDLDGKSFAEIADLIEENL